MFHIIYGFCINRFMENFCDTYNVSRETYLKLEKYCQSLSKWQQRFNLVSNTTVSDAWNRHFIDSIQLFSLIPTKAKSLLDMGTGAGFPGMVLAIVANEKAPCLKVTLVESITKKTLYLNYVKDLTDADVEIINGRVEQLKSRHFDVIMARAMTALEDLFVYAYPLLSKKGICIFPKGKKYAEEIAVARNKWFFDCKTVKSCTSDESEILIITNLVKKGRK